MPRTPSIAQLRSGPPAVDLQTAARVLGLGRTKAYELARRGEFPVPVRRIGTSYRVPVAGLLAYLGISETEPVPPPRPAPVGRPVGVRPVTTARPF